jgi:ATP-dependent helicase HepA
MTHKPLLLPTRASRGGATQHLLHRFVRQVDANDGVAWCSGIDKGSATLLYTDIPGVVEETRKVPVTSVRPVELSYQTRVWLPSNVFGWIPAEVVGRLSHGRYLVRVPGFSDLPAEPDQFRVRWSRPLGDPALAVAHGLVESREYYDARQPLLKNTVQQRAAYKGFAGAASAAVLPFQHQLDVLSRVTSDPIMRFILADEVGLGKTIEAGLVMRQLLLDDPRVSIAVLVPEVLVRQWGNELTDRLALGRHLDRVLVAPHGAIADAMLRKPNLLVIDEAHTMAEQARWNEELDQQLTLAARSTPGLLLLTATPMHAGANGFLRLLNLIDPAVYRLDDAESFNRRLQMRQEQASKIELLRPGVPARTITNLLREFADEYGRDSQLLSLLEQAMRSVSGHEPDRETRLAAVAAHLRETYRISRRVIRNRRDAARTQGYPVSGRQPVPIDLHDHTRPLLDSFLDDWRGLLARNPVSAPASRLFNAGVADVLAGGGPALEFILARLAGEAGREVVQDATERALLRTTAAALELRGTHARVDRIVSHVQSVSHVNWKVLIFTSFTTQAGVLAEAFRRAGSRPGDIALHTSDMTSGECDDEVSRFAYEDDCRVMIADNSAAEGCNFQMVDELIFLDLPLSPNALEQRIGRVDRFNLRAKPGGTRCTYLAESGSPWTHGLEHFLRNVAGVFNRSVATLQRPMEILESGVHEHLLSRGFEAFDIPVTEAEQLMADERIELDLLSEIEDIQVFTDFSDASFDDLLRFEETPETVADAFRKLTRPGGGGIGIQVCRTARHADIYEFRLPDARYAVQGLNQEERALIQQMLPGKRTFDKLVAGTQTDVRPLRIGEPLVDWLADFLTRNERGRSIAMLVRTEQVSQSQLWLRFDYLIEFDDRALARIAPANMPRLRRRGDAYFNPRVETVWTNGVSEAPPQIHELLVASSPGSPPDSRPLRGRAWQEVLPHFQDWAQRCAAAAASAAELVRSRPAVTRAVNEALAIAAAETARRATVIRARATISNGHCDCEGTSDDLVREAELAKHFEKGLRYPRSELLACTAVVLLPAHG